VPVEQKMSHSSHTAVSDISHIYEQRSHIGEILDSHAGIVGLIFETHHLSEYQSRHALEDIIVYFHAMYLFIIHVLVNDGELFHSSSKIPTVLAFISEPWMA